MNSVEMYFVAFKKHGEVQCLLEGPFVDSEKAEEALKPFKASELISTGEISGRYVVVEASVPILNLIIVGE